MKKRDAVLARRLERTSYELRERMKELRCVYGLSKVRDLPGTPEQMFQKIVELLPPAWQFPALACARLVLRGTEFKTAGFVQTRWRQMQPVTVLGRHAGFLELCYRRRPPAGAERAFLRAEGRLLRVVAERLGKIVAFKEAELDKAAAHERLRELLRSVENAREDERRRIAHELHDELGHALMAMKMDVSRLKEECSGQSALMNQAQALQNFIDVTLRNLKRVASELKPVLLDDFGLPAAAASLVKDFEARQGVRCRIRIRDEGVGLASELSIGLYRIIQELLTNIARHARAGRADIHLSFGRARLTLGVRDDGRGIAQDELTKKKTLGLLGIRERVHGWGGTLRIRGRAGRGTSVRIVIPLARRRRVS